MSILHVQQGTPHPTLTPRWVRGVSHTISMYLESDTQRDGAPMSFRNILYAHSEQAPRFSGRLP